jgi:hypothetical protein
MLKLRETTTSLSSLQGNADPSAGVAPPGLVVATIYLLTKLTAGDFPAFFAGELEPALHQVGISVLATYATEHSQNNYPALPVRDDADVFVWMTIFRDEADHTRRVAELEQSSAWRDRIAHGLAQHLDGPAEVLRLRPTSRSLTR